MEKHFVQPRIIVPLVCATVFKVAGYSIVSFRIGSVFFGVLAVISLYGVMRYWFGERQAFWIAVATIIQPWFFESCRRARPEIHYTALCLATLWCVAYALDSNSKITVFFAGVLAALASLAHPSGFILDLVIVAAVLTWLRNKTVWHLLLWACIGFIITFLPYIFYVLWAVQDPDVSFLGQVKNTSRYVGILTGEIRRWRNFLQWPKGIPLAVILSASWFTAWYRSTSKDKVVATIIAIFVLILPFSSVNNAGRYLMPMTPFFAVLVVRLAWRFSVGEVGLIRSMQQTRFVVGTSILVVYMLICVTSIFMFFYHLRGADYTKVLDRIAMVLGPEDHVYGEKMLWLGHDRYRYGPFTADYTVRPWKQTVAMVRKHKFDYAVRSAWQFGSSYGLAKPPDDMPEIRFMYTIDVVCRTFGTKIDEFHDPYFGPYEIYKLNWDQVPRPFSPVEKYERLKLIRYDPVGSDSKK
jgi:hypothetical protein